MTRQTFWIVLLVSLSHAMVHTYELVFPAVEQNLAKSWDLDTRTIGNIAMMWALPFGMGALAAGWLADRVGSRRVLIWYLIGASVTCLAVRFAPNVPALTAVMFLMGTFASLYHPAGLAYISRVSGPKDLGQALGYHGIVGALGIAGAPFIAGTLLNWMPWHDIYLALAPVGLLMAGSFWLFLPCDSAPRARAAGDSEAPANWIGFATVCAVTMLFGLVYRGFVTFLPRYLSESGTSSFSGLSAATSGSYLTAGVLLMGIFGQFLGGWFCSRVRVERLLMGCMLANIPFLLWLGTATGPWRVVATGVYAVVHFMMQPVGNTLIAQYSPSNRRSLAYGINFFLSFGVGSVGAGIAGHVAKTWGVAAIYPGMAAVAGVGVLFGFVVLVQARRVEQQAASVG